MKKRLFAILLTVCMVISMAPAALAAEAALLGEGTPESPYLIKDLKDLKAFRDSVNGGKDYTGEYVQLDADIDLKDENWTPIGVYSEQKEDRLAFNGTFDGNNKKISNLKIEESAGEDGTIVGGLGFFGYGGKNIVIKDLTIENVEIVANDATETWSYAAAVLACTDKVEKSTGAITGVTVQGDIVIDTGTTGGEAGVIIGAGRLATVDDCHVDGEDGSKINGYSFLGGIRGWCQGYTPISVTTNCSVKNITLEGAAYVGGIVSVAQDGNEITGNSVENVTIKIYESDHEYADGTYGSIIGCTNLREKTVTISNNGITSVTAVVNGTEVSEVPVYGAGYEGRPGPVAENADVYYGTLNGAVKGAESGTITLLEDVVLTEGFTLADGVTLDTNGNTITAADGYTLTKSEDGKTYTLTANDEHLLGDVDLDGDVDMDDFAVLMRHVLQAEIITNPVALAAAEVTGDDSLDMDDAAKIMKYALKAIDSLN